MSSRTYLSIGDVLTLLREEFPDVTISKIRFLESQGLVNPERSPSGYRKFFDHDVERLRWVLRQQREHFLPLKVIRDRLADGDLDDADPANGKAVAAAGVDATDATSEQPTKADEEAMARILADASRRAGRLPEEPAHARRGLQVVGDEGGATSGAGTGAPSTAAAAAAAAGAASQASAATTTARTAAPSRTARGGATESRDAKHDNGSHLRHPAHAARETAARARPSERASAARRAPEPSGRGTSATGAGAGPTAREGTGAGTATGGGGGRSAGAGSPVGTGTGTGTGTDAAGMVTGASLTLDELCAASGLTAGEVAGLESFGLVRAVSVAGIATYDEEALALANLAAGFRAYGIEPRHLRLYRNAVDRELGLIEQVVIPLLRQRNPESRQKAVEAAEQLAALGQSMRATLLHLALRQHLGG